MFEIELPDNPAGFFQDGWPVYRKIVDNNYMFHREIYGDITSFIGQRFQQRPISVLEMGCGDASQTAEALRNCRVSSYQGCDLSEVALGLAGQNLLPLSCPVNLVCTHMLEGLSQVDEPFDVVFSSFALHHLGQYEKAVESYARAIELNPLGADGRRAWNNRGAALDNLHRHEEAIESYEEALMIDPFDIYAWNNQGVALGVLTRHEEAISCFLKAVEIEPEYATAWKNLGLAYQSLHRDHEAEEAFIRAKELGL